MMSALFWDITQCVSVISSRRFGTTHGSHRSGPLKMCESVVRVVIYINVDADIVTYSYEIFIT